MRKEPFIYIVAFLTDCCFALVALCIPLLAMRLGATYDDLGVIGGVSAIVYAVGCLVSGHLSSRVGYRRMMTVCSIAMAFVLSLYPLASQVWHVVLLAGAVFLVLSGFWPPTQAWLGRGKDRRGLLLTLGRFNVCWSSGVMVGPAIGGRLFAAGPHWPFAVGSGVVVIIFLAVLLVKVRETTVEPTADDSPAIPAAARFLPIAWIANFATFFATGNARALFPKLATDMGVGPASLGRLMSLIGMAQLFTFFLISRTERWQFRLSPLVASQVLGMAGLLCLAFGNSQGVFAIGLMTQGALAGVTFTASIFYSLFSEGAAARRAGFHEAIIGSGFFVGPLVGGIVAEHLGARTPYLLCAAVILLAISAQTYVLKKRTARGLIPQAEDSVPNVPTVRDRLDGPV